MNATTRQFPTRSREAGPEGRNAHLPRVHDTLRIDGIFDEFHELKRAAKRGESVSFKEEEGSERRGTNLSCSQT